jgi:DNA-binding GntR family transcriptional regulator
MSVREVAVAEPLLYEALADELASMIDHGALRPGDRLPSVRRLRLQRRVSVSTVLQAYTLLESRGRVEARPQSGHYVRGSFTAPYSFATRSLTVTCDAARGARAMRGSGSAAPRVPRT